MQHIQSALTKLHISTNTLLLHHPHTLLHRSSRQHPECPDRIISTLQYLQSISLPIAIKQCTNDTIGQKYHAFIKDMWYEGINKSQLFINTDTYFMKSTYEAALAAVDTVIEGVSAIISKQYKYGFILVRPPGHHCGMKSTPHGFSFINNVAVGVNYALNHLSTKKIAIIDWDVHHGEGTQHIFYNSRNVLYLSIHRYDEGKYFPHLNNSGSQNVGEKEGQGYNINICWNLPTKQKNESYKEQESCGDRQYFMCFKQVVIPILKQFDAEMIFVSCGFDSAQGDSIGNLKLTNVGYAFMTQQLMKLDKKIIMVLQGGYNLQVLKWGTQTILQSFAGCNTQSIQQKINKLEQTKECNQLGRNGINECKKYAQKYWNHIKL